MNRDHCDHCNKSVAYRACLVCGKGMCLRCTLFGPPCDPNKTPVTNPKPQEPPPCPSPTKS